LGIVDPHPHFQVDGIIPAAEGRQTYAWCKATLICSGVNPFLLISLPPATHYSDITRGSFFRGQVTLDTVPNNSDLMAGCKFADTAVNLAGRVDPLQFFPAP